MYDTVEEAAQKLRDSVVLYNGNPVYIVSVGGAKNKVRLSYASLPWTGDTSTLKREEALISDPLWDFKTCGAKLGYTQMRDPRNKTLDCVFLSRIPTRRSRQGLDSHTVSVQSCWEYGYEWNQIWQQEGIVQTMHGKFLSSSEAFKNITNDPITNKQIPISRKMMMTWDRVTPPVLVYRGEKVGYTEDGNLFKLAAHKSFLKEELSDMHNLNIA